MLRTKPTKNLTGITIQGDYNDFKDLVDSIYGIVGLDEEPKDFYYGVKTRLLGICYDIRHAFMGDRDIVLEDNGMYKENMKAHGIITPTQNVYYSVDILFPEAIFVAISVPYMYCFSRHYYGTRALKSKIEMVSGSFAKFVRDKANLDVLFAGIWEALGEVIGNDELEKISKLLENSSEEYDDYVVHYIDKCNVEYLKTAVEKRKDKIKHITKRIIKKPDSYYSMESDLKHWSKVYKTSIYDLTVPEIVYPEEIEW